jgi:hypothetical protein
MEGNTPADFLRDMQRIINNNPLYSVAINLVLQTIINNRNNVKNMKTISKEYKNKLLSLYGNIKTICIDTLSDTTKQQIFTKCKITQFDDLENKINNAQNAMDYEKLYVCMEETINELKDACKTVSAHSVASTPGPVATGSTSAPAPAVPVGASGASVAPGSSGTSVAPGSSVPAPAVPVGAPAPAVPVSASGSAPVVDNSVGVDILGEKLFINDEVMCINPGSGSKIIGKIKDVLENKDKSTPEFILELPFTKEIVIPKNACLKLHEILGVIPGGDQIRKYDTVTCKNASGNSITGLIMDIGTPGTSIKLKLKDNSVETVNINTCENLIPINYGDLFDGIIGHASSVPALPVTAPVTTPVTAPAHVVAAPAPVVASPAPAPAPVVPAPNSADFVGKDIYGTDLYVNDDVMGIGAADNKKYKGTIQGTLWNTNTNNTTLNLKNYLDSKRVNVLRDRCIKLPELVGTTSSGEQLRVGDTVTSSNITGIEYTGKILSKTSDNNIKLKLDDGTSLNVAIRKCKNIIHPIDYSTLLDGYINSVSMVAAPPVVAPTAAPAPAPVATPTPVVTAPATDIEGDKAEIDDIIKIADINIAINRLYDIVKRKTPTNLNEFIEIWKKFINTAISDTYIFDPKPRAYLSTVTLMNKIRQKLSDPDCISKEYDNKCKIIQFLMLIIAIITINRTRCITNYTHKYFDDILKDEDQDNTCEIYKDVYNERTTNDPKYFDRGGSTTFDKFIQNNIDASKLFVCATAAAIVGGDTAIHQQKYLKYKSKYLQLKNKMR